MLVRQSALTGYNHLTLEDYMRIRRSSILCVLLLLTSSANAQQAVSLSPLVRKYARVTTPKVVLEHVRVIDGTGRPPVENQNVVIERGKITEVQT